MGLHGWLLPSAPLLLPSLAGYAPVLNGFLLLQHNLCSSTRNIPPSLTLTWRTPTPPQVEMAPSPQSTPDRAQLHPSGVRPWPEPA